MLSSCYLPRGSLFLFLMVFEGFTFQTHTNQKPADSSFTLYLVQILLILFFLLWSQIFLFNSQKLTPRRTHDITLFFTQEVFKYENLILNKSMFYNQLVSVPFFKPIISLFFLDWALILECLHMLGVKVCIFPSFIQFTLMRWSILR